MTEIGEIVKGQDRLLSNPIFFPEEFKTWLADRIAISIPLIPFSHIFGSRINIARSGDYVITDEAGGSDTSYVDIATVGPQLTQLADGSYLVAYGAKSRGRTSISENGSTPSDNDSMYGLEDVPSSGRMKIITLKNNNQNTLKLQYKGLVGFSHRWLVVMRIGPP